jgi:uncharacterized membrane protein YraQ (UPF0718 family)
MIIFLSDLWDITLDAAPYLCLGFFLGALLHRYVKTEWMIRLLGKGRIRATVTAAAIGIPLPLCSCAVVPTALAMQKKGASRGATLAFLISTPETGVDSILLTYGMMGPLMAIMRPLAALLSAISAGFLLESFPPANSSPPSAESPTDKPSCCSSGDSKGVIQLRITIFRKIWNEIHGIWKSFLLLFDEVAIWLFVGLILSAVLSTLLPDDLFTAGIGSGWSGKILALLIGLPLYVCATASTPLAVVLMEKGLSAGAALVFLLVGPATNIGTIGIVTRVLGKRGVFSYLTAIISVSMILGVLIDTLGVHLGQEPTQLAHTHVKTSQWGLLWAALLWGVLVWRVALFLQRFFTPVETPDSPLPETSASPLFRVEIPVCCGGEEKKSEKG